MAHFAQLSGPYKSEFVEANPFYANKKNVLSVIVIDDAYENDGQHFINNVLGLEGTWIQTSYNTYGGVHILGGTPLRKNYAGIGYLYDEVRDAFMAPKPDFESWTLNEETCLWEAPVPQPTTGNYIWSEETLSWVEA